MDDLTLTQRLKRLDEPRFEETLSVTLGERRVDLPPPTAERSIRVQRFVELLRNAPALRERVVQRLGGDDPIAAWVEVCLRRYGRIPLLGYGERVTLSLDQVFVQRQVSPQFDDLSRGRERLDAPYSAPLSPAETLIAAAEMDRQGVVLLGDPGSGKTTLLQHLYTRVATGDASLVGMPSETLPVFLRFSRIAASPLCPNGLREHVYEAAKAEGHPAASELLRGDTRPCLVLLDGLDEVRDEATRVHVCEWLDEELHQLPTSRFVATCRHAAWRREARLGGRFLPVHVLSLSDESVADYVDRWFCAVERYRQGKSSPEVTAAAKERATRLLAVLRDPERSSRLRLGKLMYSPLLLSTLCLVAHRDHELPRHRFELYEQCLALLLDGATKPRREGNQIPLHQARLVLERLAWDMHSNNVDEEATAGFEARVARAMSGVQGLAVSPADFIAYVRDDCGVLASHDLDRYRFFHLTFMEFLAACHAQKSRDASVLIALAEHGHDARWREVISLAVTRTGLLDPFVEALSRRGALGVPEVRTLLSDCLRDADVLGERVFVEVLDQLKGEREAAARWERGSWWARLWDTKPGVQPTSVTSATSVLTLLQGRSFEGVKARAEEMLKDPDAAVRVAARAYLGLKREVASSSLTDPLTGMVFMRVEPGNFLMGSSKTPGEKGFDADALAYELPAHPVTISRAYFVAQHPVTNAVYERYVKATGARAPESWRDPTFSDPQQPVTHVDFNEAMAFCDWLSKTSPLVAEGLRIDLPTEAEWEFAARGADGRKYPWGNEPPTPALACDGGAPLARVGEHGAGRSPSGCEDMAGNVWEWCLDVWRPGYGSAAPVVDPCHLVDIAGSPRVVRGGAWGDHAVYLRCASRFRFLPGDRLLNLGFRVVVRGSRQPR